MNWENCDDFFEEEKIEDIKLKSNFDNSNLLKDKEEEIKALQLQKFKDPSDNEERQKYITILEIFEELLAHQNYNQIIQTLLTEDCEIFLFNITGREHTAYYSVQDSLTTLHQGIKILQRLVQSTYVDTEKRTSVQVSLCRLSHDDTQLEVDEAMVEIFTFNDDRICKYRVSFGHLMPGHGSMDLFEPTRKDRMFAKVKEINYALADQPDLEKVASLLDETTEFQIWSWDEQKHYVFKKENLASGFKELEENYKIKCIVPYEIYSEREYIIGTYVYHLENSSNIPGAQFVWLATCIYKFDKNINITRIIVQGELHLEGEVSIPFEVYSREVLQQSSEQIVANMKPRPDFSYSDDFQFDCDIIRFGNARAPNLGSFHGLQKVEKLSEILLASHFDFDWLKLVDFYVDFQNPSYDVVIMVICAQGVITRPVSPLKGIKMNFQDISISSFEKGKLAKSWQFYSNIVNTIPSPFDDSNFEAINIIRKSK